MYLPIMSWTVCLQGYEATPTTGEEKEEWAVKVDLNESVGDFHQQIPNMAMKVRNYPPHYTCT